MPVFVEYDPSVKTDPTPVVMLSMETWAELHPLARFFDRLRQWARDFGYGLHIGRLRDMGDMKGGPKPGFQACTVVRVERDGREIAVPIWVDEDFRTDRCAADVIYYFARLMAWAPRLS